MLSERLRGMEARREELAAEEPAEREPLTDEDLTLLQAEVREVIDGGDTPMRKALQPGRGDPGRQPHRDLPVFPFACGSTTVKDRCRSTPAAHKTNHAARVKGDSISLAR